MIDQTQGTIAAWVDDELAEVLQGLLIPLQIRLSRNAEEAQLLQQVRDAQPLLIVIQSSQKSSGLADLCTSLHRLQSDVPFLLILRKEHTYLQGVINGIPRLQFLVEPLDLSTLNQHLVEIAGATALERSVLHEDFRAQSDYGHLLSLSPKMKEIMIIINQVAPTNIKVLIRGESGTGKELVARTLYARSLRKDKPFIKVLCAALPEGLLESELFGYEKGAFTGALRRKPGKFEFANHGTIFLDEIGEISPGLQAKLLQILQDGEFSRVGGQTELKVDTRVLAATNKNLEKAVADGSFREDLYYRINVVSVFLPPLRERKEEIGYLVEYFLERFNHQYSKSYRKLSEITLERFHQYDWPGNIRELENVVKRIVVLDNEEVALAKTPRPEEATDIGHSNLKTPNPPVSVLSPITASYSLKNVGKEAASHAERDLIRSILYQTHWNRTRAAELLQISYKALLYKIKKYNLNNDA